MKVLVARFSSIGDIVLTTPVLRCIKQQLKDVETHFVTKEVFQPLLVANPHVDKIHVFKKDVSEIYDVLVAENYDFVVDLHRNLRSLRMKRRLGKKSGTFNKLNLQKALVVNFKMKRMLPPVHITERYFRAVKALGVKIDHQGLEFYIPPADEVQMSDHLQDQKFIALVAGGSYYTKRIPLRKLEEICSTATLPVVMLGDQADNEVAMIIKEKFPAVINLCGKMNFNQSASVVKQAAYVITSDTGLMHVASAFHKTIISVWGNTIPAFGMSPYKPSAGNVIVENNELACRPCSKLGFGECPLQHFKCMNEHDFGFVAELG